MYIKYKQRNLKLSELTEISASKKIYLWPTNTSIRWKFLPGSLTSSCITTNTKYLWNISTFSMVIGNPPRLRLFHQCFVYVQWNFAGFFLLFFFPTPPLAVMQNRFGEGRWLSRAELPSRSKWRRHVLCFLRKKPHLIPSRRDVWSLVNPVTSRLFHMTILLKSCREELMLRYENTYFLWQFHSLISFSWFHFCWLIDETVGYLLPCKLVNFIMYHGSLKFGS